MKSAKSISELRNLGPASEKMLKEVGVHSVDDLRSLGPVLAYLAVKQSRQQVSLNLLWAIYGALNDVHWTAIAESTRESLLSELDELSI